MTNTMDEFVWLLWVANDKGSQTLVGGYKNPTTAYEQAKREMEDGAYTSVTRLKIEAPRHG